MKGLVLEGGGGRGAYHVGAIEALKEHGIDFDGVAGTSIGALNAAMIVQGDWELCKQLWSTIKTRDIMDFDDDIFHQTPTGLYEKIRGIIKNNQITEIRQTSSERMRSYVEKYLDENRIRESKMDFGLVTFSTSQMQPYELMKENIPQGKLVDYVIASANYPLYRSQNIDGKNFIDGGVWDNMPIKLLAKRGYDDIVVIRTKSRWQTITEKLYKNYKITYIVPSEKLSFAMNFTREKLDYYQKLGYFDALRMLDKLKGKKYYIKPEPDTQILKHLKKLPEEMYLEVLFKQGSEIFGQKSANITATCDMLRDVWNLDGSASLADVFTAALEDFALLYEVPRWQIYVLSDFAKEIYNRARKDIFDRNGKLYSKTAHISEEKKEIFATMIKYYK